MPNREKPLLQPEHATVPSAAVNRNTRGAFIANETGVTANTAPTLDNPIPNQATTIAAVLSFQFATDVFGDTGDSLTYTATLTDGSALPAWLTFTPGTRTFGKAGAAGVAGTYSIRLKATDSQGQSATDEFDIVVAAE